MQSLAEKLEVSRSELLDMGLRGNTLLNFRLGAKALEVIDEKSREVFRILVTEQKPMSFISVPESLEDEGEQQAPKGADVQNSLFGASPEDESEQQTLHQILEDQYADRRHTDNRLQTKLTADALDKSLLKISTEAESYYQEQGVDLLYLALGFLTWYEHESSSTPRKAPLVLVPVALERSSARASYKVAYTQADLGPNLTLANKLKSEFEITLPEFGEELDIDGYLKEVADSVDHQPRWQVQADEIALGFFSFGKFQMYQDLDPDNWPEDHKPYDHEVLQKLLDGGFGGVGDGSLSTPSEETSSELLDFTDLHFVLDADSSQTQAVMAVKQDANLVIQGPPGTGKSQTIANIIAEALADKKTVLFVAEKMAALEVVKRRLDECHLGDAVLELHSHKSNKSAVLQELRRTLELGPPAVESHAAKKRRHAQLREQLDAYCREVNRPILTSGTSYINAQGHLLNLKEEAGERELPALDFAEFRHWDGDDFTNACANVRELVEHLEAMGTPAQNPFAQSTIEHISPIEQNEVVTCLTKALASLSNCWKLGDTLSEEMGLDGPEDLANIRAICRAGERVLNAPSLEGVQLTASDWKHRGEQIEALIQAGEEMTALQDKWREQLIEQAWQANLLSVRQAWATTGRHWWRFIFPSFRRAQRTLQGLVKGELPAGAEACVALIDDILKHQALREPYTEHECLGESLLGIQWKGPRSDWSSLKVLSAYIVELHKEVGEDMVPEGLLKFLENGGKLEGGEEQLEALERTAGELKELIDEVSQRLGMEARSIEEQPLVAMEDELNHWRDQIGTLEQMARYNHLRKKLCASELEQIDRLSYDWTWPPALLLTSLKKAYYEGLVNEAYNKSETLKRFNRMSHESAIVEFRRLDEDLLYHAQEELVLKHYHSLPAANAAGEMAIIRREINKKRRHMPIRRLITQAGRAIQQIKPVFMMSPMSVATYLEQGALNFDLVVFDEASQVKVVDAIGPILRGKQVVVVGDTRQMPPTDFFNKALELDDEESQTADIESILSMFLSQGAPESMLRWHYRSRHDSLIAVSNREFYDGRLMIFPSPGVNPYAKGLTFNHLSESVYERGSSRTNPMEACAVAEAVMRHAKVHPDMTLGVVAFSTAQRDCILLEIERLRRLDPSCEEFFTTSALEGFFVKNLENVQGDERDVIFISIGYGRTAAGNVSTGFGPVNREGGERRLNVLITRARLAMEVFSNFTADDIKTESNSPFGVRALKSFLHYAQTGELDHRHETGKEADSPFEEAVSDAIRHLGYDIEPQVGSAGFYIDIAVRDPEKPGRYILAVECDGASYHSSATARDRDRLRQSVLEGLGWRFHRIWSTDWFRDPHKESVRLKDSIDQALRFYEAEETHTEQPRVAEQPKRIERDEPTENNLQADAYVLATSDLGIANFAEIHELPLNNVAQAMRKVIDIEGPVHLTEAARRLAESAGFARVGSRMLGHIKRAATYGQRNGFLYLEGDFLFADSDKPVRVRDRSDMPPTVKKIELVPDEEVQAALVTAIHAAFSMSEEEAISEALSLMGFRRVTAKANQKVGSALRKLVQDGAVTVEGDKVSVA
ncbi:MAG: DUF3320 domain-containing protein [Gemmatimonadetes bacterium]|nr:DUF3320 domain-containing protein [Gemmatimonadota bacterium]